MNKYEIQSQELYDNNIQLFDFPTLVSLVHFPAYNESNVSNNTSSSFNVSNQSVYPESENKMYFEILYLEFTSCDLLTKVS